MRVKVSTVTPSGARSPLENAPWEAFAGNRFAALENDKKKRPAMRGVSRRYEG